MGWPASRYEVEEERPARPGPADREPARSPAGNAVLTEQLRTRPGSIGPAGRDASVLPAVAPAGNAAVTRLLRGPAATRPESAAPGATLPVARTSGPVVHRAPPTNAPATPAPATTAPATPAPVVTDDDREEFSLLQGKIKKNNKKATPIKTVEAYVEYRNDFFGSAEAYEAEKATADAEFDEMKKGVWRKIGQTESKAAKKVLYRWVRKAYLNAGITDPVSVIKAGMTEELRGKLAAVEADHPDLETGGFVVRPMKLGGYKLGTLSEHATGRAADIVPQDKNPHLPRREWAFVEEFTGLFVDRTKSRWHKDPGGLWQDIYEVNQIYVLELTDRVAAVRQARIKAGKSPEDPPPYEEVLAGNKTLIKTAAEFGVAHGFFDLPESLVLDLAAQGLVWGATFGDPDLHHFELP